MLNIMVGLILPKNYLHFLKNDILHSQLFLSYLSNGLNNAFTTLNNA